MSEETARRFSNSNLVACVKRELALRKNVYPGLVNRPSARMRQSEADYEIQCMTEVLQVLQRCFRDHGERAEAGRGAERVA